MDENCTPVGGRSPEAIGIANRQHRHTSSSIRCVGTAITDALTGRDDFDLCYLRLEGKRSPKSFETQVAQVKVVPAGECISYGCTYRSEEHTSELQSLA